MKKIIGKFKSFNGKQIAVLTLCFAFLLTTIAGVIGSGELSLGYKSSDASENVGIMMESESLREDTSANFDFTANQEYAVEENGSVDGEMSDSVSSQLRTPLKDDVFKPAVTRVVTKKAELYIETKDYEKLINLIESKVEDLYGYIESSNDYDYESNAGRSGFMTIRVPTEDLDVFITSLEEKATVRTKTIKTDDITSDYVDTESMIAALETEQATLLDLLSKAGSLSDTIQIQDRLTNVRQELQYYESMMMRMNDEVVYSTVYIDIDEVEHTSASGTGFWHDVKTGFIDSLYDIAEGFKIMAIWFVSALPFVAILIVCGIIVRGIIKVNLHASSLARVGYTSSRVAVFRAYSSSMEAASPSRSITASAVVWPIFMTPGMVTSSVSSATRKPHRPRCQLSARLDSDLKPMWLPKDIFMTASPMPCSTAQAALTLPARCSSWSFSHAAFRLPALSSGIVPVAICHCSTKEWDCKKRVPVSVPW